MNNLDPSENREKTIIRYLKFIAILSTLMLIGAVFFIVSIPTFDEYEYASDDTDEYEEAGVCNVAGIVIDGSIDTVSFEDDEYYSILSSDVVFDIQEINRQDDIEAIVIEFNSEGGYLVASEEIMKAVQVSEIPVIAHIRSGALSGAYLVASATDIIFASRLSDIGSIAVTQSYLDESLKNKTDGLTYNALTTGEFKDMLSLGKILTSSERFLLERDLKIAHDIIVSYIAENRGLAVEEVAKMADGSSMMGDMALEKGLIDKIGGYKEIEDYLREELGIEPEICF